MVATATVVLMNESTGGIAFQVPDGSYVLAEQIDAKRLRVGQQLLGQLDSMGIERLSDQESRDVYGFFVQAWGLTFDAARRELI